MDRIVIKGAREHNLKNIDLELPRGKLIVITGVSGSGKSSLAFDTIYAEGQRRYVESLSAYARQFLGLMEKPDVDYIEGLSPAIAIEQKSVSHNPRSTVGTVTEIYDYLRLLFARVGTPYCPNCKIPITSQTVDQIVDKIMEFPEGKRLVILAPVVRGRKGIYKSLFEKISREGFVRVKVDGRHYTIEEALKLELDRYKIHTIQIVVDRIIMHHDHETRTRIADSVETALRYTDGVVSVEDYDSGEETVFSTRLACVKCGFSFPEIEPRLFSFNSPYGACPECSGLGIIQEVDPELVIDENASLAEGAIRPWKNIEGRHYRRYIRQTLWNVAEHFGIDMNKPWKKLPEKHKQIILYGSDEEIEFEYLGRRSEFRYISKWEGVIPMLERRYRETDSDKVRQDIEKYMTVHVCPVCKGARLRSEALHVLIDHKSIADVTEMSVEEAKEWIDNLKLDPKREEIARQIKKEISSRLGFLLDVGVGYLTLNRTATTLSGGESQRIHLATQIGSSLTGVLYVLDEPSIGLHPRDNYRLINTLKRLRDLGNTVIVVEHDEETIRSADFIVDLGPGAGESGGYVVATGSPEEVARHPTSLTGKFLRGELKIETPANRRKPSDKWLVIKGVRHNNLKNITVKIPLGLFVVITGVSGSGKSSLISETLYPALARHFYNSRMPVGEHDEIEGLEHIDKVVLVDQSPIGRTPRSNPATYTGVFDHIRALFANTREAKIRGYKPGRFSFNVPGGRCEACKGAGVVKIEMHFLPDVYVTCDACHGRRYNRETLEIRYKGKNIYEVLEMTIEEALAFFENIPQIKHKLQVLYDVGLGYMKLGQPATTLSGGEAQRVKLAAELSKKATGKTVYILDEPTTGLHIADVQKLLDVLNRLVEAGNTVIVIEHHLDVIKFADWIIDLGPEGGEKGGYIVAQGPPEAICKVENSYTGKFLKKVLEKCEISAR